MRVAAAGQESCHILLNGSWPYLLKLQDYKYLGFFYEKCLVL
jgi:hypothetical protein